MIGAIIGDIVGSPYEGSMLNWVDDKDFTLFADVYSRFTDDTVLTCATANAILADDKNTDYASKYMEWNKKRMLQ